MHGVLCERSLWQMLDICFLSVLVHACAHLPSEPITMARRLVLKRELPATKAEPTDGKKVKKEQQKNEETDEEAAVSQKKGGRLCLFSSECVNEGHQEKSCDGACVGFDAASARAEALCGASSAPMVASTTASSAAMAATTAAASAPVAASSAASSAPVASSAASSAPTDVASLLSILEALQACASLSTQTPAQEPRGQEPQAQMSQDDHARVARALDQLVALRDAESPPAPQHSIRAAEAAPGPHALPQLDRWAESRQIVISAAEAGEPHRGNWQHKRQAFAGEDPWRCKWCLKDFQPPGGIHQRRSSYSLWCSPCDTASREMNCRSDLKLHALNASDWAKFLSASAAAAERRRLSLVRKAKTIERSKGEIAAKKTRKG